MSCDKITIYKNKKTGLYLVQPMAKHPTGASADFGDPTSLTEEEFESRIVSVVQENLRKYHQQTFDQKLALSFSDEEYSRFTRGHNCVCVTVDDNGIVELIPAARVPGGYVGLKEGNISISKYEIGARLAGAIRDAFRDAR